MWSFRRLSIWSEPRKLRLRSFSVPRRDQMNSHKNASLTPKGREAMVRCVEAGLSNAAAARQFNTTPKTVAKWVERFRAGGVDGLRTRSRNVRRPLVSICRLHHAPWPDRTGAALDRLHGEDQPSGLHRNDGHRSHVSQMVQTG